MFRPTLIGYIVLESQLVKIPGSLSGVTPRTVISPLDHVLTNATFYSALVYDQVLDDSLLVRSLEATLGQFHQLSGRLELVEVGHRAHELLTYVNYKSWCLTLALVGCLFIHRTRLSNHRLARRTTTSRSSATTKELGSRQQHAKTPSQTLCRAQEPRSSSRCSCCPS